MNNLQPKPGSSKCCRGSFADAPDRLVKNARDEHFPDEGQVPSGSRPFPTARPCPQREAPILRGACHYRPGRLRATGRNCAAGLLALHYYMWTSCTPSSFRAHTHPTAPGVWQTVTCPVPYLRPFIRVQHLVGSGRLPDEPLQRLGGHRFLQRQLDKPRLAPDHDRDRRPVGVPGCRRRVLCWPSASAVRQARAPKISRVSNP